MSTLQREQSQQVAKAVEGLRQGLTQALATLAKQGAAEQTMRDDRIRGSSAANPANRSATEELLKGQRDLLERAQNDERRLIEQALKAADGPAGPGLQRSLKATTDHINAVGAVEREIQALSDKLRRQAEDPKLDRRGVDQLNDEQKALATRLDEAVAAAEKEVERAGALSERSPQAGARQEQQRDASVDSIQRKLDAARERTPDRDASEAAKQELRLGRCAKADDRISRLADTQREQLHELQRGIEQTLQAIGELTTSKGATAKEARAAEDALKRLEAVHTAACRDIASVDRRLNRAADSQRVDGKRLEAIREQQADVAKRWQRDLKAARDAVGRTAQAPREQATARQREQATPQRREQATAQQRAQATTHERERAADEDRERTSARERERAATQERGRATAQGRERATARARDPSLAQRRDRDTTQARERTNLASKAAQAKSASAEAEQRRAAKQSAVTAERRAATEKTTADHRRWTAAPGGQLRPEPRLDAEQRDRLAATRRAIEQLSGTQMTGVGRQLAERWMEAQRRVSDAVRDATAGSPGRNVADAAEGALQALDLLQREIAGTDEAARQALSERLMEEADAIVDSVKLAVAVDAFHGMLADNADVAALWTEAAQDARSFPEARDRFWNLVNNGRDQQADAVRDILARAGYTVDKGTSNAPTWTLEPYEAVRDADVGRVAVHVRLSIDHANPQSLEGAKLDAANLRFLPTWDNAVRGARYTAADELIKVARDEEGKRIFARLTARAEAERDAFRRRVEEGLRARGSDIPWLAEGGRRVEEP